LEKEQKPKYFANYLRGPSKITLNKSPVTQPKKKKKPIDIDTAAKRASDKTNTLFKRTKNHAIHALLMI
jgi:hypothetical protein